MHLVSVGEVGDSRGWQEKSNERELHVNVPRIREIEYCRVKLRTLRGPCSYQAGCGDWSL